MEELILSPTPPSNFKSLALQPNPLLHVIYTYSSRYISMPEKQKPESSQDTITSNQPFFKQAKQRILTEYHELQDYLSVLEDKFLQVNRNQLSFLSDKHRYFLRKFQKFFNQHKKLTDLVNNLDKIVIESQPVQQQIKSIDFIKMISAETNSKLQALKQSVSKAQEEKTKNQRQILDLKQKLNLLKTQYFAKKRQQLRIQTQIQRNEQTMKEKKVEEIMKKIRIQKRNKQSFELKRKIFLTQSQYSAERWNHMPNSLTRPNDSNSDATLIELKNINSINHSFIKKLSQTCENFKTKKLQDKKQINRKIISQTNLQNLRFKSRQDKRYIKLDDQDLLKNQEIIKQLTITNQLRQQFQSKKPEEILNMVIINKKLKDLLKIIQEVKNQQTKQSIIEKRKVNMARSESYKKSTNLVLKTLENEAKQIGKGIGTLR